MINMIMDTQKVKSFLCFDLSGILLEHNFNLWKYKIYYYQYILASIPKYYFFLPSFFSDKIRSSKYFLDSGFNNPNITKSSLDYL